MNKFCKLRCAKLLSVFLMPLFLLLCFSNASAQTKRYEISGKVTDASKGAIPGVGVKIQSTNFGIATNSAGNFSLNVDLAPGTYQLVFSYIGYKSVVKTITLGNTSAVTVNAELADDAMGLDEVIVTGTSQGTTRKQLGSYVSSVKGDDLLKSPSGNVLSGLQGKTPGAQISQNSGDPAGGMSVRLRGISSIGSSSDPLFIIDGVVVNNSTKRVTNTSQNYDGDSFIGNIGQNRMVDINPNDIERIEVLNGAAAAAIYGSRANAGVIQIFTKRGASGKAQVNFSTSTTISELRKQLEVSNATTKFGTLFDNPLDVIQPTVTTITPVTRYNYQDYIFRTAMGTDNTISVSGGNDDTKFYTSAGYFKNQGIIKNTDFTRYNFRANVDQKLASWAKLIAGFNYIHSNANEKPDANSFFSPINSITIIGNYYDIWSRDALGNLKAINTNGRVNPVSIIEDVKQRQYTNRIIANAGLKLNPIKNLTIDYTMGVDNSIQNGTTFIPPYAYNANPLYYGGGTSLDPTLNGYASAANATTTLFNNELNFNYDTKINSNLLSTTQLGGSYQYQKDLYALLNGRGLAPLVETVNGASTALPNIDSRSEFAISGAYLQQNFKYKDHLFVTGAVRVDQSTVFGENERVRTYLKANMSYVPSSAAYWKNLGVSKWWDSFKVRAAYGESGNLTGIGPYARFNEYSSTSFLGKTALNSSSVLANTSVVPEVQKELEIGTDMSFFKNRLGLTFNWYNKKVRDLLLNVVIAPSNGFASRLDNFGGLTNKGIELMLTGTPVKTADFKWNTTLIYNRNRNKAFGIGGLRLLSTNAGAPIAIIDGQPVGVFYGTFFARNADGSLLKNADGVPRYEAGVQTSATSYITQRGADGLPSGTLLRKVIGNPNPDYTMSIVNDFSYKKFNLHLQIDAVKGGEVWNADFRTRQGVGTGKIAEQIHSGLLPRYYLNTASSGPTAGIYALEEWRVDDGSFVKLREISMSYNIGKVGLLRDLTVNLSGRNLVSWDNYRGYDPEVNSGGQSTILRNIDFGAVPIPRTFTLGLQVKF